MMPVGGWDWFDLLGGNDDDDDDDHVGRCLFLGADSRFLLHMRYHQPF